MSGMPLHLGWDEIALRLAATVVAGLVLGFDRSEHGKAAGMRTTLLVRLAASVATRRVRRRALRSSRIFSHSGC